jgi:hypothetical protein
LALRAAPQARVAQLREHHGAIPAGLSYLTAELVLRAEIQ